MDHRKSFTVALAALFAIGVAACGGETADEAGATADAQAEQEEGAAAAALVMPEWMTVDHDAQTVTLELVAGSTEANNRWNFNGHANGDATVVVPQGYEVTLEFINEDPVNPHSVGVDSRTGGNWPATFQDPQPVFSGAITSGATSMTDATAPGGSETITFTADRAGDYSLVCYVPAHAATGMWIGFRVSADRQAGLQEG